VSSKNWKIVRFQIIAFIQTVKQSDANYGVQRRRRGTWNGFSVENIYWMVQLHRLCRG